MFGRYIRKGELSHGFVLPLSVIYFHVIGRFDAPAHLEILQTLLLAPSCPRPILCLCGPRVLSLLDTRKGSSAQKIDANSIRREINQAVGNAEGLFIAVNATHTSYLFELIIQQTHSLRVQDSHGKIVPDTRSEMPYSWPDLGKHPH